MKADRKEVGTHIIKGAMATVYLHNESIDPRINRDEEKHFCCELIKHLSVSLKQTKYKRLMNFVEFLMATGDR